MKPKVIAIVGPTSSGKSSLGIYLAQKLKGEVISADSRQVYKGLNIGTGKVTKKEMASIKHHLLSIASPKKQFTVDDFVKRAEQAVSLIYQTNNKIPIVVGGTGLYVDMVLGRMAYPAVPPNPALRTQLENKSLQKLFTQLQKLDPRRAATIERGNKRRIIRAIEIAKAIGMSPLPDPESKYNVLWLGINPPQEKLHKNIHTRLLARMKAGMVAEARRLHKSGLSYKRMEALGLEYRHLARLLQKKISEEQFLIELERDIKNYAKRQHRWFKRNQNITWVTSKTQAALLAKAFLSR